MTRLVLVLGDARTRQTTVIEAIEALPDDVEVGLITRVQPDSGLRAVCTTVEVLTGAVPAYVGEPAPTETDDDDPDDDPDDDDDAAEEAESATPLGGLARARHGLGWRARRVKLKVRRTLGPTRRRATQLAVATAMVRHMRHDDIASAMMHEADIVCAVDSWATAAVWRIGRDHPRPALVQGVPAAVSAISRAVRAT